LAEAHFKLGLALEYSEQYELALEEVHSAMESLKQRITDLEKKDGKEAMDAMEEKEIGELKGFLVELDAKLSDIQSLIEKEAQGEKIAQEELKSTPAVVNDISGLVKKRKQEVASETEKKQKME
jgi:Mg2+ and Co2+ transporter CorA